MNRDNSFENHFKNKNMTAASQRLARCHHCTLVNPLVRKTCQRCGSRLHARRPNSVTHTVLLLLSAIIFYVPANIFPIMITEIFGQQEQNTIFSGILVFIDFGDYLIALIIFLASIVVPLLKILILAYLCFHTMNAKVVNTLQMHRLYVFTEIVGRWSMIDVFVVAILVGIIQFGTIMVILPGPAIIAFSAVVLLTMLAALSFDPRLIWDLQAEIVPADRIHP